MVCILPRITRSLSFRITVMSATCLNCCFLPPQFSSLGCGHNKSCLRDPEGCDPESDPHCFFLSFTTDEAGQSVMFELSGPAEGYISFALSLDKWMVSFIVKYYILYWQWRLTQALRKSTRLWSQFENSGQNVVLQPPRPAHDPIGSKKTFSWFHFQNIIRSVQ